MALGQENLDQAARDFSAFAGSGWPVWISGLRAFREAKYSQAETDYARALEAWRRAAREPAPSLDARLAPHPDMASALADLGGAELLAGHPESAIATLDQAVNAAPAGARALYLRARAREKAGAAEAALADYNLASRTAFAQARDLASGEAHFYRGILLYRRKDYARAEDEFSSALNFEIPASLRADAAAWRHLAAVAGGACGISRQFLMRVLGSVSPYFPKEEAAALLSACRAGGPAGAAPPK
jgi:tetratricopeptide (TPR) repeat protein